MKHDKIKGFIDENREQFDELEPNPQAWNKIRKNMVATGLLAPGAGKVGFLAKTTALKSLIAGVVSVSLIVGATKYYKSTQSHFVQRSQAGSGTAKTDNNHESTSDNQPSDNGTVNEALAAGALKSDSNTAPTLVPNATQQTKQDSPTIQKASVLATTSTSGVSVLNSAPMVRRWFDCSWKEKANEDGFEMDTVFTSIHHVVVKGNGFDWQIVGNEANDVKMRASANLASENSKPERFKSRIYCTVNGDTLTIGATFKNPKNKGSFSRHANVWLNIPHEADLTLVEECGNVNTGHLSGNRCDLITEDGNIKVSEIMKNATISTSTGNVKIERSEGTFTTHTRLGNVKISNTKGKLNLSTNTGNIMVDDFTGEVNSDAGTGNSILGNCGGKFNITTNTGNCILNSCSGQWDILTERGNIKAQKLHLTGDAVFSTTTGNINVQLTNPAAEVAFDLHGETGKISLQRDKTNQSATGSLQVGTGKFKLTTHVDTGNQEFECGE